MLSIIWIQVGFLGPKYKAAKITKACRRGEANSLTRSKIGQKLPAEELNSLTSSAKIVKLISPLFITLQYILPVLHFPKVESN